MSFSSKPLVVLLESTRTLFSPVRLFSPKTTNRLGMRLNRDSRNKLKHANKLRSGGRGLGDRPRPRSISNRAKFARLLQANFVLCALAGFPFLSPRPPRTLPRRRVTNRRGTWDNRRRSLKRLRRIQKAF
ncbi:hypothetical protein L596_007778 [Steinernema carpocapsae]|uniref:Uncharacterized protein n=1 Tax=Steinernema carpocapsae TaxID=34508 RepID=A0A4V6A636_STECR|nr:hypothetical protein L596_007778 [Steinernema carpocapsae]